MASVDLEYNQGFKIYKGNTWFNNLVLHKATYETVVMSLGDKISGIVYYKNNKLVVDMTEYIMYKDVKYVLVNPPTVIKEGLVSDNGELKGMTKYSFTFYHPMYMLSNFPFSDVAVDNSQKQYLSQNKTFSWIGNLTDYVAKLNKNLEGTQWKVLIGTNVTNAEKNKLSEVLSFDNNTIADALKTAYETWEIPYIVDKVEAGTQDYLNEKRFIVQFGLPSNEIYEVDEEGEYILDDNNEKIPFVFKYGQGVGLKNNSRTPKNNKIVTRIAGYGSEDNIPYGYPQIVWTGESSWNYTINNASGMQTITVGGRTIQAMSYPIYDGIVGGQKVRLIKHPFTRTHLMPPIYSETVNNKVNPNATGYDPDTELVDYYDADDNTYPNQIKAGEQSYEIHEFEDIKPEFDPSGISSGIYSATPYDGHSDESITQNKFLSIVDDLYTETDIKAEKTQLNALRTSFVTQQQNSAKGTSGNYEYDWSFKTDGQYKKVKYASSGANFEYVVNVGLTPATIDWDDTMDEQGNYVQSYFKVTIPALGFDLYASAAITQEMTINMRSGACIGCSFPVMVDWDDYKRNFYDKDGNFAPTGTQRNYTKYPNSTNNSITLILQKETSTFGTLMPNIYQKPASGNKFVILGISLPTSYITTAEGKLETEMKKYMRDNNVYYYEYPLKFDEHFLISNEHILSQMKPNVIVNFEYADVKQSLYIKQMSIKYNESPLPKYDITLTDDVDVVLNKIGEAIAEYRGQRQYENRGGNSETLDGNKFLRKDINDTASGTIRMLKGLQVGERFVTGLLGEGGIFRKDDDGTTYLECDRMYVRMKAYFDTVEVRRFLHSGGNRIASAAGVKCSRVECIATYNGNEVVVNENGVYWIDTNTSVTLTINLYRCYFRAENNGTKVTNDFVVGDLAYCKETNIDTNLSQHGYWRAVVGVSSNANSSGEHWIDLSRLDCSSTLNDIPIAQDDIIQLGNKTDKKRQGAIVEYVSGEDAPSYQIYQGINTYNLNNKNYIGLGYSSNKGRAYMNVYGDFFFGDKAESTYVKYNAGTKKLEIKADVKFKNPDSPTQDTTLEDFASAVTDDIDNLQSQIDGQIETWFYDYDPTVVNAPASNWTTVSEKNNHLGDLFYNTTSGYAWRWGREETAPNVYEYKWYRITDVDVVKALADAAKAQDTADHKRRVFTAQPYPPYDVGDLWSNAIFPANNTEKDAANNKYYKDLLTCKTAKAEGGSFAIADWGLTTNYTDDAALIDFVSNTYAPFVQNIQGQVDQKAETWYQDDDPSLAWTTDALKASHVGDIWCNTSQNGGKKTYIWKDFGTSANPRYAWAEQAVPDAVFDKIDGKADIFVSKPTTYNVNDMWIIESGLSSTDMPTGCQSGDIVISSASRVNNYQKTDWSKKDRYTDDTRFESFISQIINGTGASGNDAVVANAISAVTNAINEDDTEISGGLVLTSLIGLRSNSQVWAGISGLYKTSETGTGYKGHGIAAWYGGRYADWEVYLDTLTQEQQQSATITDAYAKSLFRFDGSGYLAGGNITWDAQGRVAIKDITTLVGGNNTDILNALATFNSAFRFTTAQGESTILNINPQYAFSHLEIYDVNGNHAVATTDYVNENFVTKAFFNRLFQAYSNEAHTDAQKVNPNDTTTTINNLKILVGTWTEQYLSALGLNSQSSGGGGIGDVTWDLLASNGDTHQIAASHLNVLNGYLLTTDISSWAKASTKPSYTLEEVSDGTTRKLVTYTFETGDSNGTFKVTPSTGSAQNVSIKGLGARAFDDTNYVIKNDHDYDVVKSIYSIGSCRVFTGNKYTDSPTPNEWVSGLVLGSNWDDNHYQSYLVESRNGRWYTTRAYENNLMKDWNQFAYVTDNVASATKLHTARMLWGQSFDGTANVTGAMSSVTSIDDVLYFYFGTTAYRIGIGTNEPEAKLHVVGDSKLMGNITMNGAISGLTSIDGLVYFENARVGIGVSTPDSKLHVSGNVKANNYIAGTSSGSYIQIGLIKIEYEQSTQSLKVYHTTSGTNANIYATGAVSALGSNSQSSGGGVGDVTWEILGATTTSNEYQIDQTHINGVAMQSWVTNQGYISQSAGDLRYLKLAGGTLTGQLVSSLATGTAPISVTSTTVCTNLNADMLDGKHATDFMHVGVRNSIDDQIGNVTFYYSGTDFTTQTKYAAVLQWTNDIELSPSNTGSAWYSQLYGFTDGKLCYRKRTNGAPWSALKEIAFTNSNVASATRLSTDTAYTAWGQTFFSSGVPTSISNTGMTGVTSIDSLLYFDTTNGRIGIGSNNSSPSYTLDVSGTVGASDDVTITNANGHAFNLVGSSYAIAFHIGSSGTNRGIYDMTTGIDKWLLYFDSSKTILNYGNVYIPANVGIGVSSPSYKLDVAGTIRVGSTSYTNLIGLANTQYLELGSHGNEIVVSGSTNTMYVNNSTSGLSKTLPSTWYWKVGSSTWADFSLGIVEANTHVKTPKVYLYKPNSANDTGAVYIECDSNHDVKLVGNFYATGAVSALGANSGSGGGGVGDVTWDALATTATGGRTIHYSYINDAVLSYGYISQLSADNRYVMLNGTSSITGDLIPASTALNLWLGSSSYHWTEGHIDNIYMNSTYNDSKIEIAGAASTLTIKATSINNPAATLSIQNSNDAQSLSLCSGGGNVGIGTSPSSSHKLYVNGTGYFTGSVYFNSDGVYAYKFAPAGNATYLNIISPSGLYVNGTSSWSSDIRKKDIVRFIDNMTINDVALAPVFDFKWKDRRDDLQRVGTSAQYWQNVLPNSVVDMGEFGLSLDYNAITIVSSVITARKVLEHEGRIRLLEIENQALRKEIEQLKKAA